MIYLGKGVACYDPRDPEGIPRRTLEERPEGTEGGVELTWGYI